MRGDYEGNCRASAFYGNSVVSHAEVFHSASSLFRFRARGFINQPLPLRFLPIPINITTGELPSELTRLSLSPEVRNRGPGNTAEVLINKPRPHNEDNATPPALNSFHSLAHTMSRSHRPSTTPMDFEWTNQTGPIDSQSPFLAAASQQKKRKLPRLVLRVYTRWETAADLKASLWPARPALSPRLARKERLCDADPVARPRQPHDVLQPRSQQATALDTGVVGPNTRTAQPVVSAHTLARHRF
jgi:hypothetical protein